MKNHLRYAAIKALDWLDDTVLEHGCYALCCWVTLHPWREALCGGGCRDRNDEGFCCRCGRREVEEDHG